MTTNQAISRSEEIRKKKSKTVTSDQTKKIRKSSHQVYQSSNPSTSKKSRKSTLLRHGVYQPGIKRLEKASSTAKSKTSFSGFTIPSVGPRLVSAILAVLMGFLWITIWNSNAYVITGAEIAGTVRLIDSDLNAALPVVGKSIFTIVPEDVEKDLVSKFPEIESVEVKVALPNKILATITERTPVVVWIHPDGTQNWIDANGFSFPVRGEMEGLISISSFGDPPTETNPNLESSDNSPETTATSSPYIQPLLIANIIELNKLAPEGASISYNPKYGLGWKDPHGWRVYFGESTQDVSLKMDIYQAIIDKLTQQGIQPSMISVEYMDAPFYRTD
jgi:cell division protein FtsQ